MKSFCIIGLGKFGLTLAELLANNGKQVLVIDTDPDKVNAIADLVTHAVIGDATNEAVLRSAGVTNYQCAIVCMTENINANIFLTITLKEMGVKTVVARAANEGHHKVLQKIGADAIVFPEKDMAEKLAFMLRQETVTEMIDFHGYRIMEITVPDAWVGKTILELEIRRKYDLNVLAVIDKKDRAEVSPSPSRKFEEGERISVLGADRAITKLTKLVR